MIDYPIEDLIKHRRGMLLVDRLVSYDVSGVVVEVVLKEDASFLNEDYVQMDKLDIEITVVEGAFEATACMLDATKDGYS